MFAMYLNFLLPQFSFFNKFVILCSCSNIFHSRLTIGGVQYVLCDHEKAHEMYMESILSGCRFLASPAYDSDIAGYMDGEPACYDVHHAMPMGFHADKSFMMSDSQYFQKYLTCTVMEKDQPHCSKCWNHCNCRLIFLPLALQCGHFTVCGLQWENHFYFLSCNLSAVQFPSTSQSSLLISVLSIFHEVSEYQNCKKKVLFWNDYVFYIISLPYPGLTTTK